MALDLGFGLLWLNRDGVYEAGDFLNGNRNILLIADPIPYNTLDWDEAISKVCFIILP